MFPINVVEKETGISKFLLRMWERRYTFPRPVRDSKGERLYSQDDIEKLNVVKLLMEEGYRPSKIINQELSQLRELLSTFKSKNVPQPQAQLESVILITIPSLEQEVRAILENLNVKKIMVITSHDDLNNLTL